MIVPARPIRVLHVVPDLRTGGAERHVTTLFSNLDPIRFSPSVVCIGAEGVLFSELTKAGIPAVALHRAKTQAIRALFELIAEMQRQRPDVVLVRGYNAEVLGRVAAVLAGVPHRIMWVHNCGDVQPRHLVRRVADRVLDRFTDAYFGVASAQKSYLVDDLGYREDKIRIIHNGVDAALFRGDDAKRTLTELGIDPTAPVVGILAALRPEKDHVTLLRAARKVADEVPQLAILVAGEGPARDEIIRTADELGLGDRTILTGSRSDVSALLAAMTVFTLTSYTVECFPMALLEAMAAARPAVCTDVGGVAEIIEDSVTGFLVPPRDPDALADRLKTLIYDPLLRERMGRAARARVEREFGLASSVARASREIAAVAAPRTDPLRRPIRMTVVLDRSFVGGVEILLLNLFKHFDPEVVRPNLVCLREAGPLADEFRKAGFDVKVLDRSGRFDVRTLPRLVRCLRANRANVVLVSHHHRAALALGPLAAKLARVPANIVAAHDMDLTSVGGRVLPKWAVRTLGVFDALVLLTARQGRYLRSQEGVGRYPWARVREVVIPNGIDLPERPGTVERTRARASLGVEPDDFVVGVVGRLSEQKAHEVLFDAVASCLRDVPNLRLVLIGDGDRSATLHRYADKLGIASRTTFMGTRRDVRELLPGLDVSCLSSVHEGVPIALMEAMAAQVPIVASDCGSVADIVEDGEQGFVVPVRDAQTLGDRLRLLAGDARLRERLGRSGRARAEREFAIERTARAYEQLLTELVVRP